MNKAYRLRKNRDFMRVYRKGRNVSCPLMSMNYMRYKGMSKFGFSVSKKIGNAVVRNKTKRRLRECLRVRIPHIKPGYHLVFNARPHIAEVSFQEIEGAVDKLLNDAGLYID